MFFVIILVKVVCIVVSCSVLLVRVLLKLKWLIVCFGWKCGSIV